MDKIAFVDLGLGHRAFLDRENGSGKTIERNAGHWEPLGWMSNRPL